MDQLRTRVRAALTRGIQPRDRISPDSLTAMATEVLDTLADDIVDDDTVADPGYTRITCGDSTEEWCTNCNTTSLFRLACYTTMGERVVRAGEVAVCQNCRWSPHDHGDNR